MELVDRVLEVRHRLVVRRRARLEGRHRRSAVRVEVGRGGLVVLLRVEVAVLALGPAVVAQEAVDRAALFLRGATVEVLEEESCEGERRSGELRTLDLFTGYGEGLVESCISLTLSGCF